MNMCTAVVTLRAWLGSTDPVRHARTFAVLDGTGGLPGGGTCGRETAVAGLQGPCPPRPACPCLRRPSPWAPWQRRMHWLSWQVRPHPSGPGEGCRCPRGPRHRVRSGSCLYSQSAFDDATPWGLESEARSASGCILSGGLFSRGARLGCGTAPPWQGEVPWRV